MKKLISIGVALALLALVVLPVGAAAQSCDIAIGNLTYYAPDTYAKIPFAILESGFTLLAGVLGALQAGGLLPVTFDWLPALMPVIGGWVGGPLGWTVDMLAWGLSLVGALMAPVQLILDGMGMDLGFDLGLVADVVDTLACGLFTPFVCNITPAVPWSPCD